jgi:virulence factor Mce-like protein
VVPHLTADSAAFGEAGVAAICPHHRVAIIAPTTTLTMFDLAAKGAALAIDALPALGDGNEARSLTQQWARTIYTGQPAGPGITGIHYRSGYNSFALVSIVTITLTDLFYLHVAAFLGFGTYQVVANFHASGGLYPKANVTYRGTAIGVVTAVTLTHGNGVDATMRLNTDTPVPENVTAGVKSVSAVGEQYVDLIPPSTPATESLRDGSHIDRSHTSISGDIAELLRQAEKLVNSVNESRLQDLLREKFTAFNGSGPELARLITSARSLVDEANAHSDDTVALIEGAQPLLDAQIRAGDDIDAAADGLARFTTALHQADPNVRATLQTAPQAIDQIDATVSGIRPTFPKRQLSDLTEDPLDIRPQPR